MMLNALQRIVVKVVKWPLHSSCGLGLQPRINTILCVFWPLANYGVQTAHGSGKKLLKVAKTVSLRA